MSLTDSATTVVVKIQNAGVVAIDRCLLDDKTSGVAEDIFYNFRNFALGTGKWIALAIVVIGIIVYLAGNDKWLKRGAAGVIMLTLVGAIIAIGGGLIGASPC